MVPLFRLRTLWLGCSALLLQAPQPAAADLFERTTIDLQTEARSAGKEGKHLVAFLTLPDCPGCREMERVVFGQRQIENNLSRHYRSVRLDISRNDRIIEPNGNATTAADFARRLRAVATPSFVFFNARGEVLYRHTGTLDGAAFTHLARYVRRGDYERQPFVPAKAAPEKATPRLSADPPGRLLPKHPDFQLSATDGRQHRLGDFSGSVVALAVGYTQCADVCPTTLAELKAAVEALPASLRPKVQVLFATLDPERDSLSILGEYAEAFRPDGGRPLLGLRGNTEQTAQLISQLKLVADKQPSASMGYTLDHTAGVFLFDHRGRLQGISPYGQPLDQLTRDLHTLASGTTGALAQY